MEHTLISDRCLTDCSIVSRANKAGRPSEEICRILAAAAIANGVRSGCLTQGPQLSPKAGEPDFCGLWYAPPLAHSMLTYAFLAETAQLPEHDTMDTYDQEEC